jgi:hypothetical protein
VRVDHERLVTRRFSRTSGRPDNRGDFVFEFRRMYERHYSFLYCSPVLFSLFVGLSIGCSQTRAKGHAKEALGDKLQKTRTAQLGNAIKVR